MAIQANRYLILFLLFAAASVCYAVGFTAGVMLLGESAVIESRLLEESRPIYVGRPQSYDDGNQRFGVLYVLDAETQFDHSVGTTRFLSNYLNQKIPPLLVVAIGTTRSRGWMNGTERHRTAF